MLILINIIFPILYNLILIFGLSTSLYLIFTKYFKLKKEHSLLSSLLTAPFILSLTLYCQFYFFPSKQYYFYVIFQSLIVLQLLFLQRKYVFDLYGDLKHFISQINKKTLASTSKIIIILFSFVFFLCSLRIFFWPINWDDQIFYIEQSYAIGQSRSLKKFLDWGEFNNGIIKYSYNPSIRPGLPLVYSSVSMFSGNLNTTILYSQIMTFYFLVISLNIFSLIIKHINKNGFFESSLVSFLLLFSSYQFINLAIMGFKELPILCIVLLVFDFVTSIRFTTKYKSFLYLGILFGIASYINLSGSVISCIILFILFFSTRINFKRKIKLFLISLATLTIISGLEFPYFFSWIITGGVKTTNILKPIINIFSNTSKQSLAKWQTYQNSEFKSYMIKSNLDKWTKGKLQGFFQFQFYGFIFWFFLLILLKRYHQIIKSDISRLILIFIALYYLIIKDVFNINRNQITYITTASHKYTVLIIPFISLIVGSQWKWIKNKLRFINLNIFAISMIILLIISYFYTSNHYIEIFQLISKIIPIHNSPEYYIDKIAMINNVIVITTFTFVVFTLSAIVIFKQKAKLYWNNHNLGSIIIIIIILFPSLIFFETNLGLTDTVKYSMSSKEIKLSKIKGWEDLYTMVNYLNNLPKESKLLFVNCKYELMEIHLNIPSKNNIYLSNTQNSVVDIQDINNAIFNNKIDYVLLYSNNFSIPNQFLIKSTSNLFLYNPNFAK